MAQKERWLFFVFIKKHFNPRFVAFFFFKFNLHISSAYRMSVCPVNVFWLKFSPLVGQILLALNYLDDNALSTTASVRSSPSNWHLFYGERQTKPAKSMMYSRLSKPTITNFCERKTQFIRLLYLCWIQNFACIVWVVQTSNQHMGYHQHSQSLGVFFPYSTRQFALFTPFWFTSLHL